MTPRRTLLRSNRFIPFKARRFFFFYWCSTKRSCVQVRMENQGHTSHTGDITFLNQGRIFQRPALERLKYTFHCFTVIIDEVTPCMRVLAKTHFHWSALGRPYCRNLQVLYTSLPFTNIPVCARSSGSHCNLQYDCLETAVTQKSHDWLHSILSHSSQRECS